MKGTVLGLESDGGVISGEDGARYRFSGEQWKGPRSPQPRDEVDFEIADGRATDVFVLKPGGAFAGSNAADTLNSNIERVRSSATGERILEIARTRPSAVIAAIVLFASIFLNYVGIGEEGVSLLNVNFALDELRNGVGMLGMAMDSSALTLALNLAWPLLAVPFLAAWILYLAWKDTRRRRWEVILYGLCAYAWIYQALVNALISSAVADTMFGRMAEGTTFVPLALGGWIVALSGLVGFWFLFKRDRPATQEPELTSGQN